MFQNLAFEQRMLILNMVLFVFIGALGYLLLTEQRTVPAPENPEAFMESQMAMAQDRRPEVEDTQDAYPKIGNEAVFSVLMPTPRPTPTPKPTPPPDPKLEDAIQYWKLNGMADGVVFMADKRGREDWLMDIDNPESRTKTIKFQGQDMDVRLDRIDDIMMEVFFTYEGREGKQEVKKSVFDEN
ncbi:hypothetical protein KQI84_05105 [bacterium]|nr:hypothetical protein [bacterium]